MRKVLFALAAFAVILSAQQGAAPKNLQVLKPADIRTAMGDATRGLGVQCTECHTAPDMSTDDKPAKLIARKMFSMTAEINSKFPDGKVHVTCYTCHRGQKEPLTAAPAAQ
jgi:hypothetical protein